MTPHDFLLNLAMVFGVAALVTVLFQWLRLPMVLGYLSAGMLIGPHVPVPLVADRAVVGTLSELGVILLMFAIGLEMRLGMLARLAVPSGSVAIAEVSLTAWLGWQVAGLAGWSPPEQIFAGAMAAISSTAVVAKVFEEQGVGGGWREGVFGVLVIEDVLAVLLLAGLPVLAAGSGGAALGPVVLRLLVGLPVLAGIGVLVVPGLVRRVVAVGRPETVVVASVGLCFGLALLTADLGWSVALGAFLAGTLIAESGEGANVEHRIVPIRDLFGALFFVSVGMSIDPRAVWAEAPVVLGLTCAVIVGKLLAVGVGTVLVGKGLRAGVQAGMSLGQIGEFSFVIAGVGASVPGGERLLPVAGAVALLTSALTPWMVRRATPAAERLERALPHRLQRLLALYAGWIEQLRRAPGPAGAAGLRPAVGVPAAVLAVDLTAILAIVAVHAFLSEDIVTWLAAWIVRAVLPRLPLLSDPLLAPLSAPLSDPAQLADTLRLLLAVVPLVLSILPLWGAQRAASAIAAEVVAPLRRRTASRLPFDPGPALARLLEGVVRVGLLAVAGLLLLAVTMPFLPPVPAALGLGLYLGLPLWRLWRESGEVDAALQTGSGRLVALLLQQVQGAPAPGTRAGHGPPAVPAHASPVSEALPDAPPEVLAGWGAPRLVPVGAAAGQSLIALNLRARSGATVVALVDAAGGVSTPTGREPLQAGWRLALAGPEAAVGEAMRILSGAVDTGNTADSMNK